MISDNQLARGIESRSIRGLGAVPLVGSVGGVVYLEMGGFGGGAPLNMNFFSEFVYVSDQFTTNVEYKIDHISKTKNLKIIKLSVKSVSKQCASFGTKKCSNETKNFEHKVKKKNSISEAPRSQKLEK